MKLRRQLSLMNGASIREKINNAAKTATSYITTITGTSGISVHDANDTSNYVNITSGLINLVTGGTSRLKAYVENNVAKLRVGDVSAGHVITDPDSIDMLTGTTSRLKIYTENNVAKIRIGIASDNNILLTPSGIFMRNSSTELAKFTSSGVQIGADNAFHSLFTSSALEFYNASSSKITSVENGMLRIFKNGSEVCELGADSLGLKGMFINAGDTYDGSRAEFQGLADAYTNYIYAQTRVNASANSNANYSADVDALAQLSASASRKVSDSSWQRWENYLWVRGSSDSWNGIIASTNITIDSDETLKDNFDSVSGISKLIYDIEPISFTWKDHRTEKRHLGFKAQDVQKQLQKATDSYEEYALVENAHDDLLSLSYTELIPLIIDQLQKQNERILALEA